MNASATTGGTLLGLPAFHVQLRYATDERDANGAAIETVNLTHPYADEQLAHDEYDRLFTQLIAKNERDGRWRLVLVDNTGTIRREFTR